MNRHVEPIRNIEGYNSSMAKSLLDKVFFVDKIDFDVLLDYGCADGTLISFLRILLPEIHYVGYDINEEMIESARMTAWVRLAEHPDLTITTDWNVVLDEIERRQNGGGKAVLILSSVIHEVYSYGTVDDVEVFWDRVFATGFDYIVIRDLIPSSSIARPADINDLVKVYRNADRKSLKDFESIWGSIEMNKNLVHYLLKYRYRDNWEREVKENYFPVLRENLLSMIPQHYSVIYHEHYVLPYTKRRVLEDFGIELTDNTHLKLILERV